MHSVNKQTVKKSSVGIAWFGQNSFAIKSPEGTVVLTDPYFPSDRPDDEFIHGEIPEGVFDLAPDVILLTHDHLDHTDIESLSRYISANPSLTVIGPKESIAHLQLGQAVGAGETVSFKDVEIKALYSKVPAEGLITHLSFIIKTMDGKKVYISGDTQNDFADNSFLMAPLIEECPDIGLVTTHPTEGEFPFFDGTVTIAQKTRMTFIVPAHYGCFSKRSYDPFAWQRLFPLHGAMPVILPYNGYAEFDLAEKKVSYGYSEVSGIAECKKVKWCGQEVYALRNGYLDALLDPRWGGSLYKLTDMQKGCEILHTPVNYELYSERSKIYGIPILLLPNCIREGKFEAKTRKDDMVVNSPNSRHCHGLVCNHPWTVEEYGVKDGNPYITVSHINDESCEFFANFPHKFKVSSRYTLMRDVLHHELSCTNLSGEPMPFGIGLHTAFNVPFHMASRGENVHIQLPADKRWELDSTSIPTERLAPLMSIEDGYRKEGVLAQGQAIRDHYTGKPLTYKNETVNGPMLVDRFSGVRIVYQCGESFRHWMIWNEDGLGGFICPEPMTWAIGAPNLKLPPEVTGYRELAPGETWRDELTIQARKDETV